MEQKYTKEKLQEAVDANTTLKDTLIYLGANTTGGSYYYIRSRIRHYNISTTHFTRKVTKGKQPKKLKWESVLVFDPNKKFREKSHLLRRSLIEYGKEYKCYKCSINTWLNQELPLHIHHIDGNFKNNLPENLEFICPHCHILERNTHNQKPFSKFGKKSKYKKCIDCGNDCSSKRCFQCFHKYQTKIGLLQSKIPNKEILIKDLIEYNNFVEIAKKYSVVDNTVRKWCKKYNLPYLTKTIKQFGNVAELLKASV